MFHHALETEDAFESRPRSERDEPSSQFRERGHPSTRLKRVADAEVFTHEAEQDAFHTERRDFAGVDVSQLIFIEVFAGRARLSKVVRDAGFQAMPIDKTAERSSQIHVCLRDFTAADEFNQVLEFISANHDRITWVHCAPACGTASQARNRPLPNLEAAGYKVAKPLRSLQHIYGLPGLQGLDKLRTEQANIVYDNTATLIRHAAQYNIQCSLENPTNSLFWQFPSIMQLMLDKPGYDVIFDNCCHGGARKKSTRWWALHAWFHSLAVLCDDQHVHASWRPVKQNGRLVYPTAEEAAYPILLCERLAQVLLDKALAFGATNPGTLPDQVPSTPMHRFLLDMLPRGKRYKPLVSCYQHYILVIHLPHEDPLQVAGLPKGCKPQARRMMTGVELRAEHDKFNDSDKFHGFFFTVSAKRILEDQLKGESGSYSFGATTCGVPREPMDFVEKAVEVGHPRSMAIHLSSEVTRVLEANLFSNPHKIALKRVRFFKKRTTRAEELREQEAALKQNMPLHLSKLLAAKRLKLFEEMLEDCGFPDAKLVADISHGFKLTGWLNQTGIFPRHTKRPQFSVETLRKLAKGLNKSIISQLQSSGFEDDIVKKTWELTKEEVDAGYIWEDHANDKWSCLAKRFGLVQKEKIRMIDDCTVGGLNKTIGVVEKFRIHCLDEMVAYLAWFLQRARETGSAIDLLGRTYDLKSAYKQFGVCEDDRDFVRIAVANTDDKRVSFMGLNSLPFGAVGSVCGFLRISMAVWFIGITQLDLAWTAYFDDYTVFSPRVLCENTSKTVEALFDLIGLVFAREGSKATGFAKKFKSLGVEINLGLCDKGIIGISHTPDRVEELSALLKDFLDAGFITSKQSESLRGRLHWFESFAFGRVANQAIARLGDFTKRERSRCFLSNEDRQLLTFLRDRVLSAPPLLVTPTTMESWTIFTDGACEGESQKQGSVGGVLVAPSGKIISYFGGVVPQSLMDALGYSKNPIYELELFPALAALWLWGDTVKGRQTVFYLDNDAARFSLIKASSSTQFGNRIVNAFASLELSLQVKVWFARVATESNIADEPSRLKYDSLESIGASRSLLDMDAVIALCH